MKPAPDHQAAAHAIIVGANSTCPPTIKIVSIIDEAPSSSWIPLARPHPATSATSAAIRHAPTSAPQGRTGRFVSVSITP